MTRHKVTPREMGKIVAQMLGGNHKRLPKLTEEQAQFLQAHYEVVAEPIRLPPVLEVLRPFMLEPRRNSVSPPPRFFIDGDETKKH